MGVKPTAEDLGLTVFEPPLPPVRQPSESFPAEVRFCSLDDLQRSRATCQSQVLGTCLRGARSRCTIDAVKHCRSQRWYEKALSAVPFFGDRAARPASASAGQCDEESRLRCEDEYLEGCSQRSRVKCEEHSQEYCNTVHDGYGVEPTKDNRASVGNNSRGSNAA